MMKTVSLNPLLAPLLFWSIVLNSQSDCLDINVNVLLEGALLAEPHGEYATTMMPTLNQYGYLPGQEPSTLFGTYTGSGQPFYSEPWSYLGEEGHKYDTRNYANAIEYPEEAIDWVLINLRTKLDKKSIVCSFAALVSADGSVLITEESECCHLTEDNYYIGVEHRNHLPVLSPSAQAVVDGTLSYNFSVSQSYVGLFGNGQKEVQSGMYAMYAGNGDQQSSIIESPRDINYNDFNVWIRENGNHSGYYNQDYDLNGDVNVIDKVLWLKNIGIFTDVD